MSKKHIKTLSKATLKNSASKGGCGEVIYLKKEVLVIGKV